MKSEKTLKSGYTTGTHAASALKVALLSLFSNEKNFSNVLITLPEEGLINIEIADININNNFTEVKVIKSHNDDIDATKGCKITCYISFDYNKIPYFTHSINHKPIIISNGKYKLHLKAGKGLGVATKEGTKAKLNHPAINPVPLTMMKQSFNEVINTYKNVNKNIYAVFEVENGEKIALQTANAKLGILGGISFLGKTGIVKPVSSEAFIDSIEAEINFSEENNMKRVILTIGNSSLKYAKENFQSKDDIIIEIGNFIFDSFKLIKNHNFEEIILISTIGKLTKIAQNCKNTNNKYGEINFHIIEKWLSEENFPEKICIFASKTNTISTLEEHLSSIDEDLVKKFQITILKKAQTSINLWLEELGFRKSNIKIELTENKY